jgi:hypothetical protein
VRQTNKSYKMSNTDNRGSLENKKERQREETVSKKMGKFDLSH